MKIYLTNNWKHYKTVHNLITINHIKLHTKHMYKHMIWLTLLNFSINISFKTHILK